MIKTHQTLLVVSLSFALAACGSSSSGSSSSDMGSLGTSKYRTIQSSDKGVTVSMTGDESEGNLMKSIKVVGNESDGYRLESSYYTGSVDIAADGGEYQHTMLTMMDTPDESDIFLVAAGFNPTSTEDMGALAAADSAIVTYGGVALIKYDGPMMGRTSARLDTDYPPINVNQVGMIVEVNFNEKTLSSDIGGFGSIRANITGNTFKGSHVESFGEGEKMTTYTEGGFYGEDAAELAGFAVQHTEVDGESYNSDSRAVFQATKQGSPEEPN